MIEGRGRTTETCLRPSDFHHHEKNINKPKETFKCESESIRATGNEEDQQQAYRSQ